MSTRPLRHYLIAGVVILAALVGAFSAGRFSAPLQVETRTIKGETVIEKVFIKGDTVYVKEKAKIVWRDRVIKPDGTITEREVEKTDTKEDTKVSITTNTERTATLTESKSSVTTLRPRWRVAVLGGASWNPPLIPIAGPLVLGAEVDIRIVGGLSAGVWANTGGSGGVSISFEF